MSDSIPRETIGAFAKTICAEARKYGFGQIDVVRLINAMMDLSAEDAFQRPESIPVADMDWQEAHVDRFPLRSKRLRIRRADPERDTELLDEWMKDQYGRHFLLSCATAQAMELEALLTNTNNEVGIIIGSDDQPIGAVAFLDIDMIQMRAELRKLIGVPDARGHGYAEEATRLWIEYGVTKLELDKIYVSTLQTHLRNIQLNESIGFKVEGLLQREVLISGERHDVLRMGLCVDRSEQSSGD